MGLIGVYSLVELIVGCRSKRGKIVLARHDLFEDLLVLFGPRIPYQIFSPTLPVNV